VAFLSSVAVGLLEARASGFPHKLAGLTTPPVTSFFAIAFLLRWLLKPLQRDSKFHNTSLKPKNKTPAKFSLPGPQRLQLR
jgi:hypothetical protein